MSERVTMPALGESVTEGTVTRWLKNVGDTIEVDEPLLEVSTDKVDTEIPSPVAGILQEILVQEDETAPVGADLAVIGDGTPSTPAASQAAPVEEPEAEEPAPAAPETKTSPATGQVSGGEKVVMPALGESVTEGTVTRWLKNVGDTIEVDEPLLEVSTDKVDTEIPSPVAGILQEILVQEDETAPVGADLAVIGGESVGATETAPEKDPEPVAQKAETAPVPSEAQQEPEKSAPAPEPEKKDSSESDQAAYVTPLVRKLATEHGVDLSSLKGTGVGGRIRKQDVLEAASAKQQAAAPAAQNTPAAPAAPAAPVPSAPEVSSKRGTTEKMSRLRKIIAQRMVESLQTSAQLTAVVEVDMSQVAALRARSKGEFEKREGAKLSFLPFISLATVETLKQFPHLNASIDGDEIVFHGAEHLGIAVDTERGLLVPVIKDAGDLNIAGLARKIADLAERTRTNKVGPDELGGGTFTISNIGSNGSLQDTPIINQPQVAILGTGAITKRPVVVKDALGGESIAIRSMMYLCLTYDHRVVDGADAGRFLSALKARLEGGAFEL
ncbi:2-oxoglutarate dehydrogenase, E2 component, dihydrolipoamide succinyltransferase [Austwickia chelonae]|uniref:2-oxoglutarate dehydrogenase, E2 component, dihydrolipoamide succinyltransferase n=1 Tax=Austwickia chelonae TaxID=100225 RepID=UPI000E25D1FB|nr:2-oxoglutarate dehydrogenase, E2 component, dihydrolipoamide succinyltransferase [Austwickia chelonae]